MVKVIIVNGKPCSGKTTFETLCKEHIEALPPGAYEENKYLYTYITSTVDFVKSVAEYCGWDGTKTPKHRRFLSDLKDLLTQWDDVPFRSIKERADELLTLGYNTVLFVDCREPAEIEKLKQALNATTLLVRRPEVENNDTSNHADEKVFEYSYDYVIWNDGDMNKLKREVVNFVDSCILDTGIDNEYRGDKNNE